MPRSMAGAAASLAYDGSAFTDAARSVWWLELALGVGVVALARISTSRWASGTADRTVGVVMGG